MEIWRKIDSFDNYEVSNLGNVKSLERRDSTGRLLKERILNPSTNTMGYKILGLKKENKNYTKQVSRLVAKAFPEICGEWFEGCQVHHKDHNPSNNCAENLIIVSQKEHQEIHNKEEDATHKSRIIFKYDMDWNLIETFESAKMAAASVCGSVESLNQAIRKKTYYYYGYYFVAA